MKVILLKDVARVGQRGTVVDVAQSYGTNVLIAKGLGALATPGMLAKLAQEEAQKAHKKALESSTFLKLIEAIEKTPIVINDKKHKDGSLFAQISEEDIADAIYKAVKQSVNPKQIHIKNPIKKHGTHMITLSQGETKKEIQIEVR
jgi:large subunit ribosomal protein L9